MSMGRVVGSLIEMLRAKKIISEGLGTKISVRKAPLGS